MRVRHRTAVSNLSRSEYSLLAASALLGAVIVATNPFATALPIAGTAAVVAMVWSIDQFQSTLSEESSTATDDEPTVSTDRCNATPCTADD
jgi:hypothetical protein